MRNNERKTEGAGRRSKRAQAAGQDIDHLLRRWSYEPGEVAARIVRASDGRDVVQMRLDMGVLQLEVDHRPDGERPGGAESYFDYLLGLSLHDGPDFQLTTEQCAEADREFVQFYQRRICWLALREYELAVRDADHSLAFMDFLRTCSPDEEWTMSHEQYRPFVIFHRTQAAALHQLETTGAELAIEEVNSGLDRIQAFYEEMEVDEDFDDDDLIERLHELRESIRDHYGLGQTLTEQLAEAVEAEKFELAAQLRDEIARRQGQRL